MYNSEYFVAITIDCLENFVKKTAFDLLSPAKSKMKNIILHVVYKLVVYKLIEF